MADILQLIEMLLSRERNEWIILSCFYKIQERISEEEQSQSALAKIQMLKTSIFKYECYI